MNRKYRNTFSGFIFNLLFLDFFHWEIFAQLLPLRSIIVTCCFLICIASALIFLFLFNFLHFLIGRLLRVKRHFSLSAFYWQELLSVSSSFNRQTWPKRFPGLIHLSLLKFFISMLICVLYTLVWFWILKVCAVDIIYKDTCSDCSLIDLVFTKQYSLTYIEKYSVYLYLQTHDNSFFPTTLISTLIEAVLTILKCRLLTLLCQSFFLLSSSSRRVTTQDSLCRLLSFPASLERPCSVSNFSSLLLVSFGFCSLGPCPYPETGLQISTIITTTTTTTATIITTTISTAITTTATNSVTVTTIAMTTSLQLVCSFLFVFSRALKRFYQIGVNYSSRGSSAPSSPTGSTDGANNAGQGGDRRAGWRPSRARGGIGSRPGEGSRGDPRPHGPPQADPRAPVWEFARLPRATPAISALWERMDDGTWETARASGDSQREGEIRSFTRQTAVGVGAFYCPLLFPRYLWYIKQ